jgi:hypothetical protein
MGYNVVPADVSEELFRSIFSVDEEAKQRTCVKQPLCLLLSSHWIEAKFSSETSVDFQSE